MQHKFLSDNAAAHRAYLRRELAEYEGQVVEQARRIVGGESSTAPSEEHLRVLLQWLDGRATGAGPRVTH
ncbi:hypothetical protein [Halomonas tibetensis]|uniref:Uncharacterized protein n=1 Tax=Halomonas tibetensis TaxID=2259590 RepID=A0ABV7B8B8_9GAMM